MKIIIKHIVQSIFWLIIFSIACILIVFMLRKIEHNSNTKYRDYANEIVQNLAAVRTGTTITIPNRFNIQYLILTEGYSLSEQFLMQTGKVDQGLAKSIAKYNQENDGVFLLLVKNRKVVALKQFPGKFNLHNKAYVVQSQNQFSFKVEQDKNNLNKTTIFEIQ
ncbi:MAG TPA: hypothetical protein DEE98_02035 [Elusimicrobia bacterium]|nr:MAG: hypothetical protein A2278_05835 [Elusimicrobia bacterium RIFOXYA12_FULL_49_49]OGS07778.1 MAG: hypothetical protein A2204_02980 [Elusimicrobia bacterium RIFOXYA1_FULL_47_7]OGS09583.1 MAG: hypothetical protein A2386_07480 [Elusimicrobia bacterium RIFOXYB1_FULL_48_9]OGS15428.1 MAG: hypothetical protein A2251_07665 [Elusimicrobia bacterium RIFOXYA2_FULL_47_53]OGS30856.1 MAG: hypothetical protein A2323_00805 [Elusimicrobia bacterium RIFOXYB2_FULL_46_23]HBU69143.1 hypothetical protein [Elus